MDLERSEGSPVFGTSRPKRPGWIRKTTGVTLVATILAFLPTVAAMAGKGVEFSIYNESANRIIVQVANQQDCLEPATLTGFLGTQITIESGESYSKVLYRRDGHGCDGKDARFWMAPYYKGKWYGSQGFLLSGDGGLRRLSNVSGYEARHTQITAEQPYFWELIMDPPTETPTAGTPVFRITHAVSGYDLTQTWSAQRDDKRNVTVWPFENDKPEAYQWIMQGAGGECMYLINLASGLALTQDGDNDRNVSTWGKIPGLTRQHWKLQSGPNNEKMFINCGTGMGLTQYDGGTRNDQRNVTTWPGQSFAQRGWSWKVVESGRRRLGKLTIDRIKCIKPSTGQDKYTEVLFTAIEIVGQIAAAFATAGASTAASAAVAGARAAGRVGVKAALKAGAKAVSKDAVLKAAKKGAIKKVKKLGKEAGKDAVKGAVEAAETGNSDALTDALDYTSLQGLFNKVYGETPDDLEVRVRTGTAGGPQNATDGVSIWPNGGRDHRSTKSQQTHEMGTEYVFDTAKELFIQLIEFDSGSADDSLGMITWSGGEVIEAYEGILVKEDSEGSLYEVSFHIEPFSGIVRNAIIAREAAEAKAQADADAAASAATTVAPRLTDASVVGSYRHSPMENAWHLGRISLGDDGLKWTNSAGVSWNLTLDPSRNVLVTSDDNPYYDRGFRLFTLRVEGGRVVGFEFGNTYYAWESS